LQSVPSTSNVCAVPREGEAVELDARGLEAPQPMMKILEALVNLPAGSRFTARTDRRPVHLYPLLAERGFTNQSEELHDGSFITHISRS